MIGHLMFKFMTDPSPKGPGSEVLTVAPRHVSTFHAFSNGPIFMIVVSHNHITKIYDVFAESSIYFQFLAKMPHSEQWFD